MSRISCFSKKFFAFVTCRNLFAAVFCCLILVCTSSRSIGQIKENTGQKSAGLESANDVERLEELFWSRVDSAKMQFTQADVDFMTGMIAHHAQALIMSDLAPKNHASPVIQTLASRIINAQKDEIESMQRWLRDRNQPVPDVQIDGLILTITMKPPEDSGSERQHMNHSQSKHEGMDHSGMPGMLTQKQLNNLAKQKGDAFDRTFLKYMIEHHKGAVIMVEKLFSTEGAALDQQAFRLASDIQADQTTEIERMQLMLKNMTTP